MSGRQWKPGDVAQSAYGRVFYSGDEDRGSWTFDDGSGGFGPQFEPLQTAEPLDLHPLVVIDPEDREQVERLTEFIYDAATDRPYVGGAADGVQAALRSLVADPKPDEPQGLGAVVEDETGAVWVRSERAVMNCWTNSKTGERFMWHKVDAIRVLSEGWSE